MPEDLPTTDETEQACRCAQEQAAHDIPSVSVGDARPFQYHSQSNRWYVEVDLKHHDPDQGAMVALYRVWRPPLGLAAFKVDVRETMAETKQVTIQRLEALASDPAHVRRNALRLAALYLRGVEDEMVEDEVSKLAEGILNDEELYEAHEALIRAIVKEVVSIGGELHTQYKQQKVEE